MPADEKEQKKLEIKELMNSEVEISDEIPAELFESYYKKVIRELGEEIEVPGFRKGHVPEKVLVEKVGDNAILHEMAEKALADYYPQIIFENNIQAIGRPEITITKIARRNPLAFKAKTAILPAFSLPNYTSIAAEVVRGGDEILTVTDEEVETVIGDIQKNFSKRNAPEESQTETGAGGRQILDAQGNPITTVAEGDGAQKETAPPLTDDFVKQFGSFESVADFKKKIKENLLLEKTAKAKEKKRITIIDAVLKKTTVTVPAILIEGELDRMLSRFKANLSSMGHSFEKYLKQINKTEEELRDGWRKDAEKNVIVQLLLQKIAEAEKISVSEEELNREVDHIVKHYPGAERDRARAYAEGVLLHEKVFQFLEGQKG